MQDLLGRINMDAKRIRCGGSGPFGESFEACLFTTTLCFRMQTCMQKLPGPCELRVRFERSSRRLVVVMLPTLIALVPVVSAEFDKCARPSGVWVGYDQVSACMT